MRRIFALLLVTPLLANCSDSTTPLAPSGPAHSAGDVHAAMDMTAEEAWPAEENWFTPGGALTLVDGELSTQAVGAGELSTQAVGTSAAPAPGAVMTFGNPDAGSSYSPPGSHDDSFHARDRINPGTVVIDAGQTVTFVEYIGHRVAIYDVGTQPQDIQPNPGPLLLYAPHRLFLQPAPVPAFQLRFVRPGKYLVICAITNHFFVGNMWGWIIVR